MAQAENKGGCNLLAGVVGVWGAMRSDFEAGLTASDGKWHVRGELEGTPADGVIVPPNELKKVAKWIQQSVTKLGASTALTDGADRDATLKPLSEDLISAVTAAFGILLALRHCAGPSLCEELKDVGLTLAETVETLGMSLFTPTLALNSGRVLDHVKHFEHISTHNRAAIRKRILHSLGQLCDANRELGEALQSKAAETEDDDDDADCMSNDALVQEERRLIETVVAVVTVLEEATKQASQQCMQANPTSPGMDSGSTNTDVCNGASLSELEAIATYTTGVSHAIDGLVAHALGGLDIPSFTSSLEELRAQCGHLVAASKAEMIGNDLDRTLKDVESALFAVTQVAGPSTPRASPR